MAHGAQVGDEKILKLLELVEENYDALATTIELVAALKKSGTLDALLQLAEMGDEIFNSLARPEVMKMIGNLMMMGYMLSQIDQPLLMKAAEKMPVCMNTALQEAAATEKGMGIRELLKTMTSPEMAALLKALIAGVSCARGKQA
ncbi:hypothetical protein apy_11390 [Aeropyrum pernix]|uniref:DUF1641 domain-containing protein n=1 Tax=Aeropyrum pernix TaxID=56636 RepID=A0A401HAJ7_AERPX|nr:DUF1641 domain-containing protein [Aeropyrum pernix]GBF09414.1 hypothetical protein apy_11390 [Aeropyrum pernix]